MNKKVIDKKTKKSLKPIIKIILGLFGVAFFAVITVLLLRKSMDKFIINTVYYNETSDLDYKVYLKENNYFDTEYLEKDLTYIASLINHIDFDFSYNYSASDLFKYDYEYYGRLELIITEKNNPDNIIYSKKDDLLPKVEKKLKIQHHSI